MTPGPKDASGCADRPACGMVRRSRRKGKGGIAAMLADKERERCQIGGWPKKGTALGVRRLDTALDVSFAPRSKHPKRCPATALQKANHTVNRRLNGYWRGRESRSSVSGRRPSRAVSCRVAWSVVYGKSRRTSAHALSGGSCAGWRGHRPGGPAPNQLEVLKE